MMEAVSVSFTDDGYLRLPAEVASRYFPHDALLAVPEGPDLWLVPLVGPQNGGLLLKQRNPSGDRSVLVWESFTNPAYSGADVPVGERRAEWSDERGALRVAC